MHINSCRKGDTPRKRIRDELSSVRFNRARRFRSVSCNFTQFFVLSLDPESSLLSNLRQVLHSLAGVGVHHVGCRAEIFLLYKIMLWSTNRVWDYSRVENWASVKVQIVTCQSPIIVVTISGITIQSYSRFDGNSIGKDHKSDWRS